MTKVQRDTVSGITSRPAAPTPEWIRVATLAELQKDGPRVVHGADRPIAVFAHNGGAAAVDNRCPHLGFPLDKGTVRDGILTCHWHEARFDLCSGCTFDLWADDVPSFETRVTGNEVFVRALPRQDKDRFKRQLLKGLAQNLSLLQAKGLVGLLADKTPPLDLIRDILTYGVTYQTTGQGLTELAIASNLAGDLRSQTLYFLLLRSSQQIAQATSNVHRPPRERLQGNHYSVETLERWFNQWILLRDQDAAERVLLTAIHSGGSGGTPAQLSDMLFGAVSQRIYSAQGHPFDLLNKMMELLDAVGWDFAAQVLPLAIPTMAAGRGAEEDVRWHHPIDLVALIRGAESRLPAALAKPRSKSWSATPDMADTLLGEDPAATIASLIASLEAGAPPHELSQRVAYAAAVRLARFSAGNEVGDWFNPQHTFTYANAVDLRDLPAEADALRKQLLEELDGRSNLQGTARLVAQYLAQNHPLSCLVDLLAEATVREDLDFHTLQVLEAGVRQARQWGPEGPGEQATHIFLAITRDLAAFCPTPRARLKTATTALRLHHGEQVYLEE